MIMSQKKNDKKVGRKPTESKKITDEDMSNLDEGITTPKDVAENRGVKVGTVHNKQHRAKLKINFENKQADPNITSQNTLQDNTSQPPTQTPLQNDGVPLDATQAIKGMLQFIDLGLRMSDTLSKGRIEYDGCSDEELQNCAEVTNQSQMARRIATQEGLSALIIIGTLVGTFGKHLKYNPPKKHKPNDDNCDCNKCKKKNEELELIQKLGNVKKNQPINDVVPPPKKSAQEVIEQNVKREQIEKRAEEIKDNQPRIADTFEATPEYKFPSGD